MYHPPLPPLKYPIKRLPRMTEAQLKEARKLIRNECCNYVKGHCIALDDGIDDTCPQWYTYSLLCKWFRHVILPMNPLMEAEILGKSLETKKCSVCGKPFVPGSNRARFCKACAIKRKRKSKATWARRNRGNSRLL